MAIPLVVFASALVVQVAWHKAPNTFKSRALRPFLNRKHWFVRRHLATLLRDVQIHVVEPSVASSDQSSATSGSGSSSSTRSSTAGARSFSIFFWKHFWATALVVVFANYHTIARGAMGMLMCVDMSTTDKRWLLDVRLQCPAAAQGRPSGAWAAGAVILGAFLLVVCIGWPVVLAGVLLCQAYQGHIYSPSSKAQQEHGDSQASYEHRLSVEERMSATLGFRYADYAVEFDKLDKQHVKKELGHFGTTLIQLRRSLVLIWDSVLDLHRLLLVLVAMCAWLHEVRRLAGCRVALETPTSELIQT